MINEICNFKSLLQLLDYFKEPEVCKLTLAQARWGNNPCCPHCNKTGAYVTRRGFRCTDKECRKDFTVTTGSIFENSKIPLRTWFAAIYLVTAHKKGISSHQLARDLNITQKTAWFILHRIRETLFEEAPEMLDNIVEVDETYIGGKRYNKHSWQRKKLNKQFGTGYNEKTPVMAFLERNGKVITHQVSHATGLIMQPLVRKYIAEGSTVVTDGFGGYKGLSYNYIHRIVNQEKGEYVDGVYHTNTVEGYFSQLKRSIIGIYHYVSPKHLHRYCGESSFRYNSRQIKDCERFAITLTHTHGKRLKYADLISDPKN
jgi:transposase-like protein